MGQHFHHRGSSLGLRPQSMRDLIRSMDRGLPYSALTALAKNTGLSIAVLAETAGIPDRTLARRKVAGRFDFTESERLLRIASLFEAATELFEGNRELASGWLTSPRRALGGETPLALSRTELGAREVENLIGRLEHGVFS